MIAKLRFGALFIFALLQMELDTDKFYINCIHP
jgi:hypothetical protein